MFERQSALSGVPTRAENRTAGSPALRLGEVRGWTLTQVAAFRTTLTQVQSVLRELIGVEMPEHVGNAVIAGNRCVMKTGPEQFWVISGSAEDLAESLRATVTPEMGAVTPLSHGRTCLFIEGDAAREVLSKLIALDLHPDVFGIDSFALTELHHTPVLIHRTRESRYELYALRTFARWAWESLGDAAAPLGYEIVSAP